jgi:hexulose-6-phosphate isomerase
MRDFIDRVGHPFVQCYFDVGNVLRTGYPQHWIRVLGGRIKKVHFKDYRINVGTLDGFVDLLSGDVDFPAVVEALNDIGYDGWCTAEIGVRSLWPETALEVTAQAMDLILGRDSAGRAQWRAPRGCQAEKTSRSMADKT